MDGWTFNARRIHCHRSDRLHQLLTEIMQHSNTVMTAFIQLALEKRGMQLFLEKVEKLFTVQYKTHAALTKDNDSKGFT